jgi:hypothetical protein
VNEALILRWTTSLRNLLGSKVTVAGYPSSAKSAQSSVLTKLPDTFDQRNAAFPQ